MIADDSLNEARRNSPYPYLVVPFGRLKFAGDFGELVSRIFSEH